MSHKSRTLRLECLEVRRCFDASWQNQANRWDVDSTQLVDGSDLEKLVAVILESGIKQLNAQKPPQELYCDVNGDGLMSAIDILSVVNVLNKYAEPLTIEAKVAADDDLDANLVVLEASARLTGRSLPNVALKLHLKSDNGTLAPIATLQTDDQGNFDVSTSLASGVNSFQIEVSDPRGRNTSTQTVLRRGDIVTNWNATALDVIRDWTATSNDPFEGRIVRSMPPVVARNLAMIHTAMFDAMNAVEEAYSSSLQIDAPENVSAMAAALGAAHQVSTSLYAKPNEVTRWDAALAESLATIPDGLAKDQGLAFGRTVGNAMLASRANDGSTAVVAYSPVDEPGRWNRTAPQFLPPMLPQWPSVKPFAVSNIVQYRAPQPPSLESDEYAAAVDQVMRLGAKGSSERSQDQTAIAVFWADGSGTATPPGHWNRIAADVTAELEQTTLQTARVFALLNMALADAGIASWDSKYHYDLWRPIDAIREADVDGNDATIAVKDWTPLLVTPPFSSYTSGHSTFSGAAANVLTALLGNVPFTAYVDPVAASGSGLIDASLIASRSFNSFDEAANEAGMSRVYGGIHFSFDNVAGMASGRSIGTYVAANYFQPKT